jgi:hypothetical protein
MKVRSLLIGTAIISSILGAVMVYLVLTVPNDLRSGALLRAARTDIAAGRNDKARESLSKIVQQYPRTDAAAAATVALVTIADSERAKLQAQIAALRRESTAQRQQLSILTLKVDEIASKPAPAPVIVQAAPARPPAKRTTVKKKPVVRRSHRRRR